MQSTTLESRGILSGRCLAQPEARQPQQGCYHYRCSWKLSCVSGSCSCSCPLFCSAFTRSEAKAWEHSLGSSQASLRHFRYPSDLFRSSDLQQSRSAAFPAGALYAGKGRAAAFCTSIWPLR